MAPVTGRAFGEKIFEAITTAEAGAVVYSNKYFLEHQIAPFLMHATHFNVLPVAPAKVRVVVLLAPIATIVTPVKAVPMKSGNGALTFY